MSVGASLPAPVDQALATIEEVEAFYVHLEQTLIATGFLNPAQPRKLMQRLRRLFSRAHLQVEEVNILRGIARSYVAPKSRD